MTAAHSAINTIWPVVVETRERRRSAYRICRALLFCALLSIVTLPEFPRQGAETQSAIYSKLAAGFRYIDVILLLLAMSHIVAVFCLRDKRLRFPRALVAPGLAFLACIAVAIAYGARHGGANFFFDWRGLALGTGLYVVWSCWLPHPDDVAEVLQLFLSYMGVRLVLLFVFYLSGEQDNLAGVSIPIFDGPVLSSTVFTGLLAFQFYANAASPRRKLLWAILGIGACLLVVICLRRTYWGELAIGTGVLLLLGGRNRMRGLLLTAVAIAIAAGVLGSSFSGRMLSLDITRNDTEFSADNADHVFDLIDAWSQVRQSPVMGIGLGTAYPTLRIRNWKPDSVMVHNAPLHVWLKYGIAGLVCYVWFHLALLTWLFRRWKQAVPQQRAFLSAAFAYLTAQFLMTLGFAPWPYSELQMTTLISFIVAAAVAAEPLPSKLCYEPAFSLRHNAELQQRRVC